MCFGSKFCYTFYFTVFCLFSSFYFHFVLPYRLSITLCSCQSPSLLPGKQFPTFFCSFLSALFVTGYCMWFQLLNMDSYSCIMFAEPAPIHLALLIFSHSSKRQTVSGNDPKLLLRTSPRRKCLI